MKVYDSSFENLIIKNYKFDTITKTNYLNQELQYSKGNINKKDSTVYHLKDSVIYKIKDSTVYNYNNQSLNKETKTKSFDFTIILISIVIVGALFLISKLKN